MGTGSKWIVLGALALVLGVGVAIASTRGGDVADEPAPAAPTTTPERTTTTGDTAVGDTTGDETTTDPIGTGADVSGPCDEAEHADDPRCRGGTDDDRSGPGGGSGSGGSGRG